LNEVLVLGAGTGSDVLQALFFNVQHIDAVEQNPQMIRLLKRDYADFSGELYSLPQVTVHQAEARAYATATDKDYDLIALSLMDGSGISSGGLYSMAENYLYTTEALQQYLQHLKPDGYLSFTRWAKLPPRDMPKLLATVIDALKQWPMPEPSQSIVLIRSWQTATLLVKNGAVTADEIERIKRFCQQNNFDLAYYPGIDVSETNRFHRLKQPYLYQAATALLSEQRDAFIDDYKFNIRPATDDRPYFSQFFKWRTLPEILSLLDQGSVFLLESGYLLLIAALVQALAASLLLLLLPLWLWQRRQRRQTAISLSKKVLVYFFALGLAFLFVEIAFIQKFILILQHPVYAITTVLASFLLSAGLGSYVSGRLTHIEPSTRVIAAVTVIALLSLVYLLAFGPISAFLLQQQDWLRYLLAIALIMPLGVCMGVPFPSALGYLGLHRADLIPWAWGVNGFASVISPILATLIAMQFGFRILITAAVVLYMIVAWTFPKSESGKP
jgi:SAM-dependent methyltransferase